MHKMKIYLSGHSNSTVKRTSSQFNTTKVRVYRRSKASWWLLLYSAILPSRADSLRSRVILHETSLLGSIYKCPDITHIYSYPPPPVHSQPKQRPHTHKHPHKFILIKNNNSGLSFVLLKSEPNVAHHWKINLPFKTNTKDKLPKIVQLRRRSSSRDDVVESVDDDVPELGPVLGILRPLNVGGGPEDSHHAGRPLPGQFGLESNRSKLALTNSLQSQPFGLWRPVK